MKRTNIIFPLALRSRRLLLILVLFAGCVSGMIVYRFLPRETAEIFTELAPLHPVQTGMQGVFSELFSSVFHTGILVVITFFIGLSAYGTPFLFAVLLFWGWGLGLTEAFFYSQGGTGVLLTALFVLPHSLPEAAAVLIVCERAVRLSLQIFGQLLPSSAHCGSLWAEFKGYCVSFLLVVPLLLTAGAIDVGMRLLFLKFFI